MHFFTCLVMLLHIVDVILTCYIYVCDREELVSTNIATVWNNSLKMICHDDGSTCAFITNVKLM